VKVGAQEVPEHCVVRSRPGSNNWIRTELNERGAIAVIPPKADRASRIPCDFEMYKWRHLVENFFQKIKEFRRIATRYDKTDTSFAAAIHLAAAFLALK
jgi:transposase